MEREWRIRSHAVKRFRQRFLKRAGKNGRKDTMGKRYRDEEVRKIMRYYLRRARIFAVEENTKRQAVVWLAQSEYGNIYFITRGTVVHTVYPGSFIANKLKYGVWEKVQ